MTVQELIDELNKLEDKSKEIYISMDSTEMDSIAGIAQELGHYIIESDYEI